MRKQHIRDLHIAANMQEYGDRYRQLCRVSPQKSAEAEAERSELLLALDSAAQSVCRKSKIFTRDLSPGCRICTQGTWSCLFINGKCPCHCFHCPTEQNQTGIPMTNTVPFPNAAQYVSYLEKFGFRGASISGGEPFVTFTETLNYIRAVKKKFGNDLHMWMYTSGVLVNEDNLKKLRDAGLNEIRFNIGTTKYRLDNARKAVGIIEYVTVEIPAIPEDFGMMTEKIREMQESGIRYLNLHQLRLTPYNFEHLIKRNYSYLHGERMTVLESELTALKLLQYAIEHSLTLPINYCSFVYKNRYQAAASRKRNAAGVRKSYEDISESGYIRSLWVTADAEKLVRLAEDLDREGKNPALWMFPASKDRLYLAESLWDCIPSDDFQIFAAYSDSKILPSVSYRNPFTEIPLTKDRKIFVERMRVQEPFPLVPEMLAVIRSRREEIAVPESLAESLVELWEQILPYESISPGLQEYY